MGCHALLQGSLPDPGIKHATLMSPALAGKFFTTRATWEGPMYFIRDIDNVYVSIPISQFIPPSLSCLVSICLFSSSVPLFLLGS